MNDLLKKLPDLLKALPVRAFAGIKKHPFMLVPFALYFFTCAPTIGLGDTALLIDEIMNLKINTHVNNHNLAVFFGWLFTRLPFGEIAFRGNLVSVFFGGLSVALFYLLIFRIFQSRIAAAAAAALFMISHSMWWHATIVECYAINALFTVIALHLLYTLRTGGGDRYLYGLFFAAGLALFNHVQMGILAVGATAFLLWRLAELLKERDVKAAFRLGALCSLFFLLGFLPYLLTFIKDVSQANFMHVLKNASGGSFQSIMFKGTVLHGLADLIFLIFKQFPSLYLLLLVPGIVYLFSTWKMGPALLALVAMFLLNTYFFMFYNTWDKFAFLLPSFVILAFCGSLAFGRIVRLVETKKSIPLAGLALVALAFCLAYPPYFYSQLSTWGRRPGIWYLRYNNNYTTNSHDCAEYIANPNKRDYRDVEEFANLVFKKLPTNAIFVDDDSRTFYPINHYFQRYYRKRPDLSVRIINSWGFSNWGLTRKRFAALLEHAYKTDRKLFLVSVDHPFRGFIENASKKRRFNFRKFDLSDKRWVYRLVTAREAGERSASAKLPHVYALKTGLRFNTNAPEEKSDFRANDNIMIAIEFQTNAESFPLIFRWTDPFGRTAYVSKPFLVPPGNTRVWSFLKKEKKLPGPWRVRAYSDKKLLYETGFSISR